MFVSKKPLIRLFVLVLVAVCFIAAGMMAGRHRMAIISFFSPLQKTFRTVSGRFSGLVDDIRQLRILKSSNERIVQENIRLKNTIIELEEHKIENERLRRLLDFKQQSSLKLLPAEIVGHDIHPARFTILINKGSLHGVERRMSVVAAEGLVGSVIDVGARSSRVMLISDYDSRTSAIVQETRDQGIVTGTTEGMLVMKYLARDTQASVNDLVISSGMGGVFMKGLVIGRIKEIDLDPQGLLKKAVIVGSVDFHKLEEIFIVLDHPREPF